MNHPSHYRPSTLYSSHPRPRDRILSNSSPSREATSEPRRERPGAHGGSRRAYQREQLLLEVLLASATAHVPSGAAEPRTPGRPRTRPDRRARDHPPHHETALRAPMRLRLSLGLVCLTSLPAPGSDIIISGGMVWTGLSTGAPQRGGVALAMARSRDRRSVEVGAMRAPNDNGFRQRGLVPAASPTDTPFVDGGFQLASVISGMRRPQGVHPAHQGVRPTLKPGDWIHRGRLGPHLWARQPLPARVDRFGTPKQSRIRKPVGRP